MSGTPQESSLSQHDAVSLLLNTQAPEEASEEVQEPTAETTEVEAPETEEIEVEAADEGQAETETEEVEEDVEDYETVETYRTKVDGVEGEATIDELITNYQLKKTAQKRLQEVAEQRKALDAEKTATEQTRKQYEASLSQMAQNLQQAQPRDQAYWDELYQNDQVEYLVQRERDQQANNQLQAVQAEQQRMRNINLQAEQAKLLDIIPEWKDSKVEQREKAAVAGWARTQGFTDQELSNATDSRIVNALRKAYLYDEQQSKKPLAVKKVKTAPKMVRSGQPKTKGDSATERKRKAFDQLKKSNSKEDAVNFLLTRNS